MWLRLFNKDSDDRHKYDTESNQINDPLLR